MENQSIPPSINGPDESRDKKGRFLPGFVANPEGNKGNSPSRGHASYNVRVEQLENRHPTIESLVDAKFFTIAVTPFGEKLMRGEGLNKLNPYDGGIIWNMILQVFADPKHALIAQKLFWDRREGTPTQTIQHRGSSNIFSIPSEYDTLEEAAAALEDMRNANAL